MAERRDPSSSDCAEDDLISKKSHDYVLDFRLDGEYMYDDLVMNYIFPRTAVDDVRIWDMAGDILVASYPRTGTTLMQELVWLVMHDGDIKAAEDQYLHHRYTFMEFHPPSTPPLPRPIEKVTGMPKPHYLKSHLPARFLAKQLDNNAKIILVIRNPKDTLVSLFHFYKTIESYKFTGTWNEFFELYKAHHVIYGDFFNWYMCWVSFLHEQNLMFIKYEDMVTDLGKTITDVAEFLGKELCSSSVKAMIEHLSFDSMRHNEKVNLTGPRVSPNSDGFVRKGGVGGWKSYFSEEQSQFVDRRYEETLKPEGIELYFG